MNRAEKKIANRILRGNLPTAYQPFNDADREIADAIMTSQDYTKKGRFVIFEQAPM